MAERLALDAAGIQATGASAEPMNGRYPRSDTAAPALAERPDWADRYEPEHESAVISSAMNPRGRCRAVRHSRQPGHALAAMIVITASFIAARLMSSLRTIE